MNEEDRINYIVQNQKSPRTFNDYMNYFAFFAPISFIVIFIFLGNTVINNLSNTPTSVIVLLFFMITMGVSMFVLLIFRLKENRQYLSFKLNGTFDEKKKLILEAANDVLKINNISVNENLKVIEINTKWSAFSWGEIVSIVCSKDDILINSRPSSSQFLTLYKDKRNVKRVTKRISELQQLTQV